MGNTSKKVLLNGVEYIKEKDIGVTKLSRNISGMQVVNIFSAQPEPQSLENFKKDVAMLVLKSIQPDDY